MLWLNPNETPLSRLRPWAPNSWNKSASNVGKDLIKTVADAMAGNGMEEAGYNYVVIDDCWQVSRDLSVPDPALWQGRLAFGCDGENYTVEFALR